MENSFESTSTNSAMEADFVQSAFEFFSLTENIRNEDAKNAINDRYFEIVAAEEGNNINSLLAALAKSGEPKFEQRAIDHLDLALVKNPASAQTTWAYLLIQERTYFQAREMLLLSATDPELFTTQDQLIAISELVELSETIANRTSTTMR